MARLSIRLPIDPPSGTRMTETSVIVWHSAHDVPTLPFLGDMPMIAPAMTSLVVTAGSFSNRDERPDGPAANSRPSSVLVAGSTRSEST